MKYILMSLGALMLMACTDGFTLPVIPQAPTVADAADEQAVVNENVREVCENIDQNKANLKGWVELADLLGGAFNIKIGDYVTIPDNLVDAKEEVCE